jgi:hypothetical protein
MEKQSKINSPEIILKRNWFRKKIRSFICPKKTKKTKTFFKNKGPPLHILAMKTLREIWMIWLFFLNLIILLLLNQKIKFL